MIRRPLISEDAGFTLVELIVVIAIISIMSAAGILTFVRLRESNEAKAGARAVIATLSAARQQAISTNTRHRVDLAVERGEFWIDELDSAGTVARRQIGPVGTLPRLVRVRSYDALPQRTENNYTFVSVGFWPDGHSDTGTIRLERLSQNARTDEKIVTIRIFGPTGLARSYAGDLP